MGHSAEWTSATRMAEPKAPLHGDYSPEDELNPQQSTDHGQLPFVDYVVGAIQRNPLLAVAGAVAVTALVVVVLKPSPQPQSKLRNIERRAMKEIGAAERRLRSAARRSGVADSIEQLTASLSSRLGSLDMSQLAPLKDQASEMLSRAVGHLGIRGR